MCPNQIAVQTSWFPDGTDGAFYHLLGPDPEIDTEKKQVTGSLVAQGRDTGVKLQLRAGGPAIGYQQTSAQMYLDTSITLGAVDLDEQVQLSASQPTLGIMAPLEKDPQIVMWDPGKHPEFNTIRDIGKTSTPVLYFEGDTYMEYLVGSGILQRSQLDGSYDGTPSRFVASGGEVTQSGYATSEPYLFEKDVKDWGKPVRYQLIFDTGYPTYGDVLVIRPTDKDKLAPCLRKLVPVMQQAHIDYLADPKRTVDLTAKLSEAYQNEYVSPREKVEFAVHQLRTLGLVGNGKDGTVGNFDDERVQQVVDITEPIFTSQKKVVKDDLKSSDLVTNEFIDSKIGFPPS